MVNVNTYIGKKPYIFQKWGYITTVDVKRLFCSKFTFDLEYFSRPKQKDVRMGFKYASEISNKSDLLARESNDHFLSTRS